MALFVLRKLILQTRMRSHPDYAYVINTIISWAGLFIFQEWKTKTESQQKKLADSVKPVLLLEDIGLKIQALDREVKYLINKAKTYKPKPKPKPAKNKTEDKNETLTDSADSSSTNETKDSSEEPIKTEESQSGRRCFCLLGQ